jgi:hypothetical protein
MQERQCGAAPRHSKVLHCAQRTLRKFGPSWRIADSPYTGPVVLSVVLNHTQPTGSRMPISDPTSRPKHCPPTESPLRHPFRWPTAGSKVKDQAELRRRSTDFAEIFITQQASCESHNVSWPRWGFNWIVVEVYYAYLIVELILMQIKSSRLGCSKGFPGQPTQPRPLDKLENDWSHDN